MIVEIARILVEAGATPTSAVNAAVILDAGGSISDAYELIELAPEPAHFDTDLLTAELSRQRLLTRSIR